MKKLWRQWADRKSKSLDISAYGDVTPDVVASLAQHRGFRLLCAIMENKKAHLEAALQQPAALPDSLDALVQAAITRAVTDARIVELGWIARQVRNAGAHMAEFEDSQR